MFVAEGAATKLKEKRKESFFQEKLASLLDEADKLGIAVEELIAMIKEAKSK